MAEYEHDEFDDVPVDSTRRGAYRGETPEKSGGFKHLAAVIVAGVCALVIGGVFFLLSPKLASPDSAGSSSSSSSQSSTDSSSSGASSDSGGTDTQPDPATTLAVYNDGSVEGTATDAAGTLTDAGWKVSDVSNWDGQGQSASSVYYGQGHEDQAKAVAQKLGIEDVKEATGQGFQVVVVLAEGYTASSGQ